MADRGRRLGRPWGVPAEVWDDPPPIPQRSALQPERTALAWQRTLVACALAAVPMLVVEVVSRRYGLLALSGVLLLALLPAIQVLGARPRQIRLGGWHVSPWPRLVGLTVAVCVLAALGATTALAHLADLG